MSHHLTERGTFKSDKYAWCPEGFFALKLTDPLAQEVVMHYASKTKDRELAADLRAAVKAVRALGTEEPGHVHVCMVCFCDRCGDCLVCYGEDPCRPGGGESEPVGHMPCVTVLEAR